MLHENNIAIKLTSQQYECECYMRNLEGIESVFIFESKRRTEEVSCSFCSGKVNISGLACKNLKDIPIWTGIAQEICFHCHRYRCIECGRKFTEDIPLRCPGTRITERAAEWIRSFLRNGMTIRAVQKLTGIHWDTIRKLQSEMMTETLEARKQKLLADGYHPQYLAVDEFAIHKGHTYATCVMDLQTGEVLWVGSGRSKADFARFFNEIEPSFLTEVKAIAMDMNASYHLLVEEKMPGVDIVYDRYHMQAQYGKDVLGAVRLQEARKHKEKAAALSQSLSGMDHEEKKTVKELIRSEKQQYSQIKRLRWTLLTNGASLRDETAEHLNSILDVHSDLAVCYAMKEELSRLFTLRDPVEADTAWRLWFQAAKESGIAPLVRFAELKESRLPGLTAHAVHPVSTGKLEGFNNKIKVAKRIGYGYRDDEFFFLLVRFLSCIA